MKDYKDFVKNENKMELSTIRKRCKSLHYTSRAGFMNDVKQIWINAHRYNDPEDRAPRSPRALPAERGSRG